MAVGVVVTAVAVGIHFVCTAHAAAALAGDGVHQCADTGYTDDQVNNSLDCRPCAKQQVNDVEVLAKEHAEADETPVYAADGDQEVSDLAAGTFSAVTHTKERKEIEIGSSIVLLTLVAQSQFRLTFLPLLHRLFPLNTV